MPSEIVSPVASQPVTQSQTSDGKANNVRVDGLAALLAKAAVPAEASAAAQDAKQEVSPQTVQPTEATTEANDSTAEQAAPVEESEATEANEEVLSHDSKLTPEQQAKIDKRIGKEVAKRKALEDELNKIRVEQAEARQKAQAATEAPPVVHQPTPDNPLADVNDINALIQTQKDAKDVKRWAEEALDSDGLENGVQYGDRVFSKSEVKTILRNAQRTLEDHIPQRHQFIQARTQAETTARNMFPWMSDKSSPEYQQYTASFRNKAYLANDPESPYLVALAMEGLKAVNARQAAEAAKKAPAKTAPKAPASQTAVSSTTTRARATDDVTNASRVSEEVKAMKNKKNFSASDAAALLSKTASLKSR